MSELEFSSGVCAFREPMYSYAYSLTRDHENAKDLVQDAIVKAFRYKNRYIENQNLKGWLITILRNTFLNNYNRDKKRPALNSIDSSDYLMTSSHSYNIGEMNMNMAELNHLVASIDQKFQRPFVLRNRGFKYDEIASKLDIPIGTVKHRIHRCREELKAKISHRFA